MTDNLIRILIADDHEIVRKGLGMVLRLEPGFAVVGEARDGVGALELAQSLYPDILLLDLKMPTASGDAVARQVRAHCPYTRIIILSGAELDDSLAATIETVDGYVLKDISPTELAHAIRTVAGGGQYFHAAVTKALLDRVATRSARPTPPKPHLSPREVDVLRLMATTATYKEIGQQLHISEETVRSHVKNILAKLEQPHRAQAVIAAMKLGLISLD